MPTSPTADPYAAIVEQCRAKIREHGFNVIGVGADPEGSVPQFAYTVGVSTLREFELAMSGLSFETMHDALSTLARKARSGKLILAGDLLVEGVFTDGYVPRLRRAHPGHAFGMIHRVLGTCPPVWQAQFPDKQRRYPGEPGCTLEPIDQTDFTQPPLPT